MVIEAPLDLIESLADWRFPPQANALLRGLMDRNTDGGLSDAERDELEGLVALSETMAIFRARALSLLGREP